MKRIGWIALAGAIAFLLAALISFDPADPPSHMAFPVNDPPANWCGIVGAVVAYHAYSMIGFGVWVAVALGLAYLVATLAGRRVGHPAVRMLGAIVIALSVSGVLRLWAPAAGPFPEGAGGLLAIGGVEVLVTRFNSFGASLILLLTLAIGLVVAVDELVIRAPLWAWRAIGVVRRAPLGSLFAILRRVLPRRSAGESRDSRTSGSGAGVGSSRRAAKVKRSLKSKRTRGAAAYQQQSSQAQHSHIDPDAGGLGGTHSFDPDDEYEDDEEIESGGFDDLDEDSTDYEAEYDEDEEDEADEADDEGAPLTVQTAGELDMEALRAKIRKLPINFASKGKPGGAGPTARDAEADLPRTVDYSGYQFPGIDLLEDPEESYSEQMEEFVREQAEALETALRTYRIEGEVVGIDSGPVITLYEVQLAPGTKVAAINSINSDIARALRAPNIRIVPNMAGKTTVGIEVPNLNKEKVRVKELMAISPRASKMMLPMFLGKDASGTALTADLTAMPHMLIAGTTGSGKSVCINTIIMSFLYTKRPDELKLILVDPKMVEMSQFKDIPHLMCPVVTEMDKAAAILEWAVTKMEERYELFAEVGVRDIAGYNSLEWEEIKERVGPMSEAEEAKLPKKLPYIVFVIDELADLIMTNKEVETFIVRVAQKARAVGIHLILATQRPQANVVTGLIKSNMPCRISFKVASGMDSRIVLDQKGAELLLGQGDMLYLSPRTSSLIRAQGTLVEDAEIRKVTRFLKTVAAPSFERQLMTIRSSSAADDADADDFLSSEKRDPLFFKAVEIIVESGRGSVSLLQRRLSIGYTRASRLIDQMGIAGIIGEHKGSVARQVLVSAEEWEQMRVLIENEEAAGTLFNAGGDDAGGESGRTIGAGQRNPLIDGASGAPPFTTPRSVSDSLDDELGYEDGDDIEANDDNGDEEDSEYEALDEYEEGDFDDEVDDDESDDGEYDDNDEYEAVDEEEDEEVEEDDDEEEQAPFDARRMK